MLFSAFSCIQKIPVSSDLQGFALFCFFAQRRDRDSNPGYPLGVHTLSRRAISATHAPLQGFSTTALLLSDDLMKKGGHARVLPKLSGCPATHAPLSLSAKIKQYFIQASKKQKIYILISASYLILLIQSLAD